MDFAQWVGTDEAKRCFEDLYALLRVFVALRGPWLRFGSRCWCFGRLWSGVGRALVGLWSYHPLVLC